MAKKEDHPGDHSGEQKRQLSEAEVARAAATSPEREQAPKPVPLVHPPKEPDGNPPAVPPSAPKVKPDPAPRLVHQNARAPEGLKRFKIRAVNYGDHGTSRYVLAVDEAAARAHYLKATGIKAVLDYAEASSAEATVPILTVTVLPD